MKIKLKSTLKKALLLTIVTLSTTFSVQAQYSDGLYAYMDYVVPQRALAYKYFYDKMYPESNEAFSGIVTKYNELSVADQKTLQSVVADAYYGVSRCFTLVGDVDNAMNAMDSALSYNYTNYFEVKNNKEFDIIKENPRLLNAIAVLRERGDYMRILSKTTAYKKDTNADLPKFEYEDKGNPKLQEINAYFNLDSIAGNGKDSERIINLLNWAHNTIKHDGNSSPKVKRTAIPIYEYVKETGTGVNCRNLSIFLNECNLAVGIRSRYVTCLPKDTLDTECHVINQAYAADLKKWIWIDPTNNAYIKDENGNLLTIAEVRQRLVDDKPVFLNEDANWNNISKVTKESYIDGYMSKNLYWFQSTRDNRVGVDDVRSVPNTYISLFPVGFSNSMAYTKTNYITNDENYFWEND